MLYVVLAGEKITFQTPNKVWGNGTSVWCGCDLKPFCFGSLWLEIAWRINWERKELFQKSAHVEVMLRGKFSPSSMNVKYFQEYIFQKLHLSTQQVFLWFSKFPLGSRIPVTLFQKPFWRSDYTVSSSYHKHLEISPLLYNYLVTSCFLPASDLIRYFKEARPKVSSLVGLLLGVRRLCDIPW